MPSYDYLGLFGKSAAAYFNLEPREDIDFLDPENPVTLGLALGLLNWEGGYRTPEDYWNVSAGATQVPLEIAGYSNVNYGPVLPDIPGAYWFEMSLSFISVDSVDELLLGSTGMPGDVPGNAIGWAMLPAGSSGRLGISGVIIAMSATDLDVDNGLGCLIGDFGTALSEVPISNISGHASLIKLRGI